jgi:hypothetical protein
VAAHIRMRAADCIFSVFTVETRGASGPFRVAAGFLFRLIRT